MSMIFQVVEFKEPDLTTPAGQLEFVFLKLHRLMLETDPNHNAEALGPQMPMSELRELMQQMIQQTEKLRGWMFSKSYRETYIEQQRALGALPWLAVKHIMLERGYTHIVTQAGPIELATYEGPYGNGIPAYYHALLRPDLGPGWFADCSTDADDQKFFRLGAWECIKHWPEPSREHHMVEYDRQYAGGDYKDVGDYAYVPANWVRLHGMPAAFTKQTGLNAIHIINWNQEDPLYTAAGEEIWEEPPNEQPV